ncbi:MAG: hypothetical protein CMF46_03195 [Legionellales bacterium]|nr:hypothetical protein [Legionellales bacterium]
MKTKLQNAIGNSLTLSTAVIPIFKACPPCPICMPKYAAIFAFFGLEMSDYSEYLIPLMLVGISMTLLSTYQQVHRKQLSYRPFYAASFFSSTLLVSKFVYDNNWAIYFSMFGLLLSLTTHYMLMGQKTCCQESCQNATHSN